MDWLDDAVADPQVRRRYEAMIVPTKDCWYWTGAISGRGHGRFWIGPGRVIIAHRYGYALTAGAQALHQTEVIAHACDNPLCQRIHERHAHPSTPAQNSADYTTRRQLWHGPLADPRGSAARARAIRDALKAGEDPTTVLARHTNNLERSQLPLW